MFSQEPLCTSPALEYAYYSTMHTHQKLHIPITKHLLLRLKHITSVNLSNKNFKLSSLLSVLGVLTLVTSIQGDGLKYYIIQVSLTKENLNRDPYRF